jgi:hypothetical protein
MLHKCNNMKKFWIIGLVLLAACGSSTQITGSWKNPSAKPAYNRIIVAALTTSVRARQTVENDLARELADNGIAVTKGFDVFPPSFTESKEPDKDAMLKKIRGENVDAIMTITLVDKETETRYVPGSYGYTPVTRYRWYGRFSGYYTNWYPTMISPGYYEENRVYFIETNLYDADTEELIWSAQSETYNPSDLSSFSAEFASIVVAKMREDGVLADTPTTMNMDRAR